MDAGRDIRALVIGLGGAQLLAWGTLYYAIAVIGEPMRRGVGASEPELFGGFAWSMVISGVLAPWAGRLLDRFGGRLVLAASALLGALGFALLASAHSLPALLIGWSVNGVAMALGLYETCFAALGQAAPHAYRRTVTGVTLIAGFASTLAWPASHYLLRWLGWRVTCAVFAGVLLLCSPVYLCVLPSGYEANARAVAAGSAAHAPWRALGGRAQLLALAFAGAALVAASISAHLVGALRALHFSGEQAMWLASSVGVMQVAGRLLELGFGTRRNAAQLGLFTFTGLAASMVLLLGALAVPSLVFAFVVVYGIANGLLTIAKAALPVELFGLSEVGALLGTFSAPSLVTRAIAPLAFAVVTSERDLWSALVCLAAVGTLALGVYVGALNQRERS